MSTATIVGLIRSCSTPKKAYLEYVLAGILATVTLAVYISTIAPGLTWQNVGSDGGDLLTAAHTWGIAHPSGYPTYVVALRVFSFLVPIGDEAFRGNLFSAVLTATSIGLVFITSMRLSRLLPHTSKLPIWSLYASASVTAIAVGVSRELWSQAIITEVYSLNIFFVTILMLGMLSLFKTESDSRFFRYYRPLLGFLLGLGLGNHLTLAMVAVPFVIWSYLWQDKTSTTKQRFSDVLVPLGFLGGLSIYLYAPLASLAKPDLNWGHPHTLEGFWWMISGALYQDYQFGVEASFLLDRIIQLGDLLLSQYGFIGLVFALVGVSVIWESMRGFAIAGATSILVVTAYSVTYDTPDSFLYLIPCFVIVGLWMGSGFTVLITTVGRFIEGLDPQRVKIQISSLVRLVSVGLIVAILLAIPGYSLFTHHSSLNLRADTEASTFAKLAFKEAGPGSVILADLSTHIFPLWYRSYVEDKDADILVVSVNHLQFDWYWDDLRRQYPERIPNQRPVEFRYRALAVADYNLGIRPVYMVGIVPVYEDVYEATLSGPLHLLEP